MEQKISSNNITSLANNEVFVFGSNIEGIHGAGAARQALMWGAQLGIGKGLRGNTYAIPTKELRRGKKKYSHLGTLSLKAVKKYVDEFINFTKENPSLNFLVTEIGCGLAGYEVKDIAPLFKKAQLLDNVYLPQRFVDKFKNVAR